MAAGPKRHRLTVEAPPTALDDRGRIVGAWTEVARVWGSVVALSGDEIRVAQKQIAIATHRVVIRTDSRLAGLTEKHRILWGARILWIQSIDRTSRSEISLDCGESHG